VGRLEGAMLLAVYAIYLTRLLASGTP